VRSSDRLASAPLYFICSFIFVSAASLAGLFVPIIFYFALFSGAIISLVYLRYFISRSCAITPYSALAVNFSSGYLVGPSVGAWYFLWPHELSPIFLSGPFSFDGNVSWFSIAIAFASLVVAVLIFIGEFSDNKLFSNIGRSQADSKIHDSIFTVLLIIVVIIAFLSGAIGFMGVNNIGKASHVTILGGLAGTILTALPAIFVVKAFRQNISWIIKAFYILLVILIFVAISITGRRYLIYSILSAAIIMFFYRPDIGRSFHLARLKRRAAAKIVVIFLLGATLVAGMSYFYALRIAIGTYGPEQSVSSLIVNGWNIWHTQNYAEAQASAQAKARSGTLPGYLGALMDSDTELLDGTCMLHGVLTATPRLLLFNKNRLLDEYSSCSDKRVNVAAGLPRIDSPITIITQAYIDFGYFGPFLYVIIIGALFGVVPLLIKWNRSPVFSVFAIAVTLNTLLYAERGLSSYMVSLRNLIIIFAFSCALMFIFDQGSRRRVRK
jgi:hypothetical protein